MTAIIIGNRKSTDKMHPVIKTCSNQTKQNLDEMKARQNASLTPMLSDTCTRWKVREASMNRPPRLPTSIFTLLRSYWPSTTSLSATGLAHARIHARLHTHARARETHPWADSESRAVLEVEHQSVSLPMPASGACRACVREWCARAGVHV
jgi:hypothetical protein